jgi:hypothetical protein
VAVSVILPDGVDAILDLLPAVWQYADIHLRRFEPLALPPELALMCGDCYLVLLRTPSVNCGYVSACYAV